MSKTAIQAYPNLYSRKAATNHFHQTPQAGNSSPRRGHVAGSETRGPEILLGFGVEADKAHHRQVGPVIVVPVEERQLLPTMRGIVGGIQIDGDAIGAMAQPLGVTPDHALGQELARTIQFLDPNSVLETRQRRLRSQIATLDRIAIQK